MSDAARDRWLSVDEIAGYLGVKGDTIYMWIDRKKLPVHKVGSFRIFHREEIDDWIRSGQSSDSTDIRKPRQEHEQHAARMEICE
jgi:excisionase family DNA binding protein